MDISITDPLDWPAEFAPLREIDSHLRCPICKEFLRAAMMLQCCHNFCSECIRRHLDKESTCPACRVATSTSQLRRNVTLDEVAHSFVDCRSQLLKIVKNPVDHGHRKVQSPPTTKETVDSDYDVVIPQQKRRRVSTRISTRTTRSSQEHHPAATDDDVDDEDFVFHSQDSIKPNSHKGKSIDRQKTGPMLRSRAGAGGAPNSVRGDVISSEDSVVSNPPPPSSSTNGQPQQTFKHSLVQCPVCAVGVPESYTNTHLDKFCFQEKKDPAYTIQYDLISTQAPEVIRLYERQGTTTSDVVSIAPASPQRNKIGSAFDALTGFNGKSAQTSSFQQKLEMSVSPKKPAPVMPRLPKVFYNVTNDRQLRKLLQELGLPTHGDKQLLQKRHAEYVTIYNANCDSTRPQSIAQLKKSLTAWEQAYERDLQSKEAQRKAQDVLQKQQQELALQQQQMASENNISSSQPSSQSSSQPSSQPSSQTTPGNPSAQVQNHVNNSQVAVAASWAHLSAHAYKHKDEYDELIADIRRRQQAEKERIRAEEEKRNQEKEQALPTGSRVA